MKEYRIKLKVPWSDTDAARVVHFANYFKYFEKVELDFYDTLGFNYSMLLKKSTIWFPRVEARCTYRSPCEFDDEIEVSMSLLEMKEKSVKYGMKVYNRTKEKLSAEGYVVVVAVDRRRGRAVLLPRELASAISGYFKDD
jgi:acyl-CoA thioester hydrolase